MKVKKLDLMIRDVNAKQFFILNSIFKYFLILQLSILQKRFIPPKINHSKNSKNT